MTQREAPEATQPAGASVSLGATMLAGDEVDQVAFERQPGEVILDL